jgi:hypothetical protein
MIKIFFFKKKNGQVEGQLICSKSKKGWKFIPKVMGSFGCEPFFVLYLKLWIVLRKLIFWNYIWNDKKLDKTLVEFEFQKITQTSF